MSNKHILSAILVIILNLFVAGNAGASSPTVTTGSSTCVTLSSALLRGLIMAR